MQIVANVTKVAVYDYIPFFCSGAYMNKPVLFIFKFKGSGFPFAVHAVNGMYYFIQVAHFFVVIFRRKRHLSFFLPEKLNTIHREPYPRNG